MKILVANKIQQAIRNCKPTKIAVAYIGADWNTFLPDAHCLDAIIVSPTIGTNPWAITALSKQIGWDKIFFLNELHAKTYIGRESAIIGSANLTSNGLSGESLVELCVEVKSDESIKKVNQVFYGLITRAQNQYPTSESKKARLKELEKIWGAAVANRILGNMHRHKNNILDFELLGEDHFYVLWYQPMDYEYSDDLKSKESLIKHDIHFAKTDKLEKNKWVFVWRITDSNTPHETAKPFWLYIHEIYKNGIVNRGYKYTTCAIQRKDMEIPSHPFEITKDVDVAFKKAVQEEEIAKYLIQDDKPVFSLAYSLRGIPPLISKMKHYMANKANVTKNKRWRS